MYDPLGIQLFFNLRNTAKHKIHEVCDSDGAGGGLSCRSLYSFPLKRNRRCVTTPDPVHVGMTIICTLLTKKKQKTGGRGPNNSLLSFSNSCTSVDLCIGQGREAAYIQVDLRGGKKTKKNVSFLYLLRPVRCDPRPPARIQCCSTKSSLHRAPSPLPSFIRMRLILAPLKLCEFSFKWRSL